MEFSVHTARHGLRPVTIVVNPSDDSGGHSIVHDQWVTAGAWKKRGKVGRDMASVFRGRIMTYMAAAEAEIACIGR
jgi:hypothetical protein